MSVRDKIFKYADLHYIHLPFIVKLDIVKITIVEQFMKTIKTKLFAKWANKNDVSDQSLLNAAKEIFSYSDDDIIRLIKDGGLTEVSDE